MGQEKYAQVNINTKTKVLDKPFTYGIPDALNGCVHVGSKVSVPFGRGNKPTDGYVVGLSETADYSKVKNIAIYKIFILIILYDKL